MVGILGLDTANGCAETAGTIVVFPAHLCALLHSVVERGRRARQTREADCRSAEEMGVPELWRMLGPGLAGAVFGGGWWFWVDAVVCSSITVKFLHYLPGIFASLAALMFNCVRRDELQDYSPFDDGEGCRAATSTVCGQQKLKDIPVHIPCNITISNGTCDKELASIMKLQCMDDCSCHQLGVSSPQVEMLAGSRTWLFLAYVISFVSLAGSVGMLVQDALLPSTPSSWTGVAGVLQCTLVLASGLMYWTSRTASEY